MAFTWDSPGNLQSYFHDEPHAESELLSDHLAFLIRRLLHIILVTVCLTSLPHSKGYMSTGQLCAVVYHLNNISAMLGR